ncbi:MAG: PaaI family thioesterase [Sulfurospirillum sp.]|nr:PaaI family thioesterase [Sulfurospirillum sp.]
MAQNSATTLAKDLINQSPIIDEFNSSFEEHESQEQNSFQDQDELKTHNRIRNNLCGTIIKLEQGASRVNLQTTKEMVVDDFGLIHSGFIASAADYAASVAINEENLVIIASRIKFLAPAKLNDLIEFTAKAKFEDSRKREIRVSGYINEIHVFEGIFQAVILENHILKADIKHLKKMHIK